MLGIFPNTEKSVWPVLLGKLFLVYGWPGVMNWIQRFHPIDLKSFANLTFDKIDGWDNEAHELRLHYLIDDNKELIRDASNKYNELKPELETAGVQFSENLYNFFVSQIQGIYN